MEFGDGLVGEGFGVSLVEGSGLTMAGRGVMVG